MNIANILVSMDDNYGGPPKVAQGLGEKVASLGNRVTYWTTISPEEEGRSAHGTSNTHFFKRERPLTWYRSPALLKELGRSVSNIDVLHIHEIWSYPQLATARMASCRGVPYLIVPHGELEPWRIRRKGLLKFAKKRAYLSLFGLSMLRNSSCLHAITPNEIDGYRRIGYQGPITVVPNGIDMRTYSDLPCPEEADRYWPQLRNRRIVLFLSRLNSEKGLDQLIPAWKRLTARDSYDDTLLVLAGPEDRGYGAVVRNLVQEHDIEDRVLLTGMVRDRKKLALISRADVYTLPSHSEGFSISVLENLAAGKPMLITPGCNFPEVAEANAGLCVPPEPDLLEGAFRQLLDMSKTERDAMGQRGRKLIHQNYTWDIAARKMITVYQCVLEGKEIPLHPQPAIVDMTPTGRACLGAGFKWNS